MLWPSWLWIGTPLKFFLWAANRLATGTGLLYLWKRSQVKRRFWMWMILINLVSLGGLILLFFWLRD